MKSTIWIFSIEPIESRYTKQWHEHLPRLLSDTIGDKFNIRQIDGEQKNTAVTPGAFLNFSDTNYWKSSQLCAFLDEFNAGKVSKDDQFLFTDAWNPTVIQLRYMNDLLGMNWRLHGLWHAGNYDENDFLGRIVGDNPWVKHAEKSFYHAYDHNYFATKFHRKMFCEKLLGFTPADTMCDTKIMLTGWPMEYMESTLSPYANLDKRDLILFPHRIAPEKQVEIFRDLAKDMPQYEWVVCQDNKLSKHEYHTLLGESKLVFSANLQETLGISSAAESVLSGALPLVPNRLSYTEIFENHCEFMYPSEWTESWSSYCRHKEELKSRIQSMMEKYNELMPCATDYANTRYKNFFYADSLIEQLQK
ncbi:hypothetical protein UFOVP116_252 [uncultured Caudovirales phage]|uniref:Uncharacterized protein n=1 Tax=uncultured Caudovirales phage TaxID=2100421 RepID=A0A6J5L7S6_9CAUD|nr:hypothetical protein UFOVP116_252 [uncultured Caudovirales phage]